MRGDPRRRTSDEPCRSGSVRWIGRTVIALIVVLGILIGAASSSAETGASLALSGVPATITVPSSFTLTVSGSTGSASRAVIYPVYGPAPCAANVEAQLAAGPSEVLTRLEINEGPLPGLTGSFAIQVQDIGEAVSSPGQYSVCVFMEASAEPEAVEETEEEQLIAAASGTFTVLPSLTSVSGAINPGGPLGVRRDRATRCVVPRVRGRKLVSAKSLLVRAHCAVGRIRRARSRHVRRGRVISQSHRPGRSLPDGAKVGLLISTG
jgi:PASTA domain